MIAELLGALLIGLSLGLLGSGGAILTVPILVYLAGHSEKQAIVESLAIVGLIALSGAVRNGARGQVDVRAVVLFGLPGMVGAFLGAYVARWVPGAAQLALLGVVMLLAAWFMFRARAQEQASDVRAPEPLLAAQGLGVGGLTGLLGVGGGFLIVPALTLLGRLPVKTAIGTSLAVIAMNCAAGFVKSWRVLRDLGGSVDWVTVALFSAVGIAG
ncbi:MAG: sulfite exporter TauE/SafE family protein, partial [Phycisphaerales bacterium]|nr:sulfite exporter TauE/SafE family protein [Phycisphaerales bacterium]